MNINLPLFESGDKIDVITVKGHYINSVDRYIVSKVFSDEILTTCKKRVKKNYISVIYKKYGLMIGNPYFDLFEKGN